MADKSFIQRVGSEKYDPQKYVQDLSCKNIGSEELLRYRQNIQSLSDDTSGQLKRNVYKNYKQFIETAKEISYLESEMYQLNHMLTEHKALMITLLETSVLGSKVRTSVNDKSDNQKTEEPKKTLTALLEKVEDCASIVDVPGRYLIHHGELVEHDPNTYAPIGKVLAFLLNDGMVIATWIGNRSGPIRYKYETQHELDAVPVVNVRDSPEVKNAFKILIFPVARLFICETAKMKKDWLEKFEMAKKAKRNVETSRRESQLEKPQPKDDTSDKNPYLEDDDGNQEEDENHNLSLEGEVMPEWLTELPEDLDVCIAQRDFEEATHLIEQATEFITAHSRSQQIKDMRPRIDHRIKLLTKELQNELTVSPDKSLQGGPRAARRAVSLLIRLGKSSQACSLFLRHHSAQIKHSIKQLKIEGETRTYIRRLCSVFFMHIMDTCHNLQQSFHDVASTNSAFVVWACDELKSFTSIFTRQVFTPQVSLSLVADCVAVARQHCNQLGDLGVDLTFVLNSLLHQNIECLLVETRDKLLEAVKLRATEDKWRPLNLQHKTGLDKFLDDMVDIGIQNIRSYVYDECWIALTSNTIHFSKAYLNFTEDVLKLYSNEIHVIVNKSLHDIMRAQLKHLETCAKNERFKNEIKFIQKNGHFLISEILTRAESQYTKKLGYPCTELSRLHHTCNTWLPGIGSVTKYSSTGFL